MKTFRNVAVVILILALAYFLLTLKTCSAPPAAKLGTAKTEAPASVSSPSDFRHRLVDEWLKRNRAAIGTCLQKSERPKTAEVRLLLSWKPVGAIETVRLVPDLGEAPRACLEELIRPFELPATGDLAPLTVSKRLSLKP